jgi:hypothetical protein
MTMVDTEADRLEGLFSGIGGMSDVAERMTAEQKTMAFFAGMSEPTRRKLGPEVLRLHKSAVALLGDMDSRCRSHLDAGLTSIALAATATIADLRKIGSWYPSAIFCRVLVDRLPDWLTEGIELVLERMTSSHGIGPIAEELNRFLAQGLIEEPRHDRYAIGVAYAYAYNPKLPPLVERLRANIERVAPAIWRQFEVEGGGEISLANFELDERVRCADRYLDLLASPIGPTVTLAVSALKVIDKALCSPSGSTN